MSGIALLFASLLGLVSWLVPNHYPPWQSFHAEVLMAGALLLAFGAELFVNRRQATPLGAFAIVVLALAAVPVVQWSTGLIHFAGDAWMASAYLLAFALSHVFGQRMAHRTNLAELLERLALLFIVASVISVGLQLYQWFRLSGLGIFAADLAPGGRPYANVTQPNHLATMLFVGLASTLYLYDRERLRGWIAAGACAFLGFGMTMTSSRTAWLSMSVLVVWLLAVRRRADLRISQPAIFGLGVGFVSLLAAWRPLSESLLLSAGREVESQVTAGPRLMLWNTMRDAILREPWTGYGWSQGHVAQLRVVDANPAGGRLFEHSHNLMLDLMVWNGVPLALFIILVLAGWFINRIRAARDPASAYGLAIVSGVFVHAMVEFPLSYTYFLLPVGMIMGALDSAGVRQPNLRTPRWPLFSLASAGAVLMTVIVVEYVQVESNMRTLRFEAARIGTHEIASEAPNLVFLTQWREYLRFARTEPRPGMSEEDVEWTRKVTERYPYAFSLMRYAVASGLNGRPQEAGDALLRLCRLHTGRHCRQYLAEWNQLAAGKYPQLRHVSLPNDQH